MVKCTFLQVELSLNFLWKDCFQEEEGDASFNIKYFTFLLFSLFWMSLERTSQQYKDFS